MPSGMGVPPPPPNYLPHTGALGWMQAALQYAGNPKASGGVQPTDTGGAQRPQFLINGTGYAPSASVPTDGSKSMVLGSLPSRVAVHENSMGAINENSVGAIRKIQWVRAAPLI